MQKTMNFFGAVASVAVALGLGVVPAIAGDLYSDIPSYDVNGGPEVTSLAPTNSVTPFNTFGSLIEAGASGVAENATVMLSNYDTSAQNVNLGFTLYR